MTIVSTSVTLASAVASAGTITVPYPTGYDAGSFTGGYAHKIGCMAATFTAPEDITVSFGASSATITYNGSTTIPAGTTVFVELDRPGPNNFSPERNADTGSMVEMYQRLISLGAPATADADGVCASQSGTASTEMTINGALASGGVATFDVPRNVVGAWTNTATLTVTGTDEYGVTIVETSGSGTSMAGKKAFKTITSVVPSANITSATVGSGDVLGLPVFLKSTGHVLKELEDGAAPTAGTVVAGVQSTATATTGDVRGTYDPNSACNGSKSFQLLVMLSDPSYKGITQYGG